VPLEEGVNVLVEQMRHFAAWIRGEVAPVSDVERGYEIQQMVNAAYQSAESGAAVALI
jgi:predicted dehydrogenase